MKKIFGFCLCLLCCLLPLSACSQPEKSMEEHVNLALEQFGKPLGEAFEAMKLPGSLEEAAKPQYCLLVENGTEVLGKQVHVALLHLGQHEEGEELTERKTEDVEYSASLESGDYAYPLKLYQALLEAYGEPEPVSRAQSFSEATEESLKAMAEGDRCANLWKMEGYELELSVSAGASSGETKGSVALAVRLPKELLKLPSFDS